MSTRCRNQQLVNKMTIEKLNKFVEVNFAVLEDIDSCVDINTKNFIGNEGISAVYSKYRVPKDLLNCKSNGCINTGTLRLTGTAASAVGATFVSNYDATEYAAGVIVYYIDITTPGEYTVTTTVSDIKDTTQTNADAYAQTINPTTAGFYPIIVDLAKMPATTVGTGWDITDLGVTLSVSVESTDESVPPVVGVSSISIFDSIEDLEANDVVVLGCIDDFTGDFTADATDASCFGAGYDPSSIAIERTITARAMTPNYWKLNPIMKRGEQTDGWLMTTSEKTVESVTINGTTYGYIQASDYYTGECAFVYASLADACNVTDGILNRVSSPIAIALNENQFIIQNGELTNALEAGRFLFNEALIGEKVIVSYPKAYDDVEHFIGSEEALEERRVSMSFTKQQNDGVAQNYIYENVLVTSFPDTVSLSEENTFEFTISVQRNAIGRFFDMFRVANR